MLTEPLIFGDHTGICFVIERSCILLIPYQNQMLKFPLVSFVVLNNFGVEASQDGAIL